MIGFGYLLPVNQYMDAGVRSGQDCDGPAKVIIVLSIGLFASALGLYAIGFKIGWRSLKTEKAAIALVAVSLLVLLLKIPEIKRELDYNSSSEASCSE